MKSWHCRLVLIAAGIVAIGSPIDGQQRPAVSVRAWLDADQIPDAGRVKVWVAIENQSPDRIADVHFDALQLHGFEQVAPCWRGETPGCLPGPGVARIDATDSIDAGAQLIRWGELTRVQSDNGRSMLFGALRWTSGTGETHLTTIPVVSLLLVSASRPLSTTELLAPVGLGGTVITLIVQAFMQRRTERQALLTTLIPKILKNSESYYLPIQTTIGQLWAVNARKIADYDELAFYWLMFSRRMRLMQHEAGGFYFKSYLAEDVAAAAWGEFKLQETAQSSAAHHPISSSLMFQVVGDFDTTSNFGEFMAARSANIAFATNVQTLILGLTQWRSTESWTFAITCAKIVDVVLQFEINRPHERWYADNYPKQEGTAELRSLIEKLKRLTFGGAKGEQDKRDAIVAQVRKYLDRPWKEGGLEDYASMVG